MFELTSKCLTSKSMVVDDVFECTKGTEMLTLAAYIGSRVQM